MMNMKCNQVITRKTMLYKTGVEYGDYTLNHVQGCTHGCLYPCYAFLMAKRFGKVKSYEEWIQPKLVENAVELVKKEIPKLKDKIHSVHLCFTTDPFMYQYEDIQQMSLEIMRIINSYDIPVNVLTKGNLPVILKDYSKENSYGITLVSLNENYREKNEPGSAPYSERIKSLKYLHDNGCKTWISLEPYPTPNILDQNFDEILEAISFVDKIIFGRLNYNKKVSEYKDFQSYYNELTEKVISFCERNGLDYHIKDGTYKK